MSPTDASWGLPDPDYGEAFYRDVPAKRFFAWCIDAVLITIVTAVVIPFTAFTAFFYLPLLVLVISFLYRWWALAARSATPGMRLLSIEFRSGDGQRFDGGTAFLHTLGYTLSVAIFPLQLVSMILMVVSARRQGLTDHILGTAAVNLRAEY